MFKYAQIDENNVVSGISQLSGEVNAENMILVNGLDVALGSTYNVNTKIFTKPKPIEPTEPQPTAEEIQTQTLLNIEYLVIMSELTNL